MERKEITDLGSGKPMETIGLGSGELEDYPFVRRLRNRRLLTYLWLQGFDAAYDRYAPPPARTPARRFLAGHLEGERRGPPPEPLHHPPAYAVAAPAQP